MAILFEPTDWSASILVNWITRKEYGRVEGEFRLCTETAVTVTTCNEMILRIIAIYSSENRYGILISG